MYLYHYWRTWLRCYGQPLVAHVLVSLIESWFLRIWGQPNMSVIPLMVRALQFHYYWGINSIFMNRFLIDQSVKFEPWTLFHKPPELECKFPFILNPLNFFNFSLVHIFIILTHIYWHPYQIFDIHTTFIYVSRKEFTSTKTSLQKTSARIRTIRFPFTSQFIAIKFEWKCNDVYW